MEPFIQKLRNQLDAEIKNASIPMNSFQETKIRALIGRIESCERQLLKKHS